MTFQKIVKISALDDTRERIINSLSFSKKYLTDISVFTDADLLENPRITIDESLCLILPNSNSHGDTENSIKVFERYMNLTPVQASDARLWVYLAHFDCKEYMSKRYPLEKQEKHKFSDYIMEHWFLNGISPNTLTRHGISRLWWGAWSTYDPKRKDPYELTRELFSMLDYTRTLSTGTLGRNKNFTHAILEFVIENNDLFSEKKEAKVRYIIRKMNEKGGYKIVPILQKEQIKDFLGSYRVMLKDFSSKSL